MKKNIVILTGAGVSAESGIPTFRDSNGLWSGVNPMHVASDRAYRDNPIGVNEFFNNRRRNLAEVEPNAAHVAIAKLQQQEDISCYLVTQNIDNLHERGGSRQVHHIHGDLLKYRCAHCGIVGDVSVDINTNSSCAACLTVGKLRPHVVFFGEIPLDFELATEAARMSDLFISIGTSGVVYPAADLVTVAKMAEAITVYANLEKQFSRLFDVQIKGKATTIVPALIDHIITGDSSRDGIEQFSKIFT